MAPTIHYAMAAEDLQIEIFEDVETERPCLLLTLNAHTNEGEHVFAAYILELSLETFAALCEGTARTAALVSLMHGPRPT